MKTKIAIPFPGKKFGKKKATDLAVKMWDEYSRRQVLNILKKWDKESKEPYSEADRFGLLEWFERKITTLDKYQALKHKEQPKINPYDLNSIAKNLTKPVKIIHRSDNPYDAGSSSFKLKKP